MWLRDMTLNLFSANMLVKVPVAAMLLFLKNFVHSEIIITSYSTYSDADSSLTLINHRL